MSLAGDLHFYMRHSFRPAPAPTKADGKIANGHVDDLSGGNPFAETAPSRLAAAKVRQERLARNTSVSGSSVASSEADEAELGRDIYQDLVSLVHNGEASLKHAFAYTVCMWKSVFRDFPVVCLCFSQGRRIPRDGAAARMYHMPRSITQQMSHSNPARVSII